MNYSQRICYENNLIKISMLFYFLISAFQLKAQGSFLGTYHSYFGHKLKIKSDSTFEFNFLFDLEHKWSKGKWTINNDTIHFKVRPIYDTVQRMRDFAKVMEDSVVLSIDKNSNLGFDKQMTHYQDSSSLPPLYYKRNRLFGIKADGKLDKKKVIGTWPSKRMVFGYKKFPTWYVKLQEN